MEMLITTKQHQGNLSDVNSVTSVLNGGQIYVSIKELTQEKSLSNATFVLSVLVTKGI